jgi:hypothetical protein
MTMTIVVGFETGETLARSGTLWSLGGMVCLSQQPKDGNRSITPRISALQARGVSVDAA